MTASKDNYQIVHIGQFVIEQLNHCPNGSVLAVFSSIIYLINENDELIWITSEHDPMHRRCIQIKGALPKIEAVSNYRIVDRAFLFDHPIQLDMAEAIIWESQNPELSNKWELSSIHNNIQMALDIFLGLPNPKGLGVYLSKIIIGSNHKYPQNTLDLNTMLSPMYWSLLDNIISVGFISDIKKFKNEAIKIIGLGNGLTPSGDDFFGGLFFCLRYINEISSLNIDLNEIFNFTQLREMTNPISYAIMSDMVLGHGVEPLHDLFESILRGEGEEEIYKNCSQVLKIGNSTGWDIITGVSVGLLVFDNLIQKQSQEIEFEEILI